MKTKAMSSIKFERLVIDYYNSLAPDTRNDKISREDNMLCFISETISNMLESAGINAHAGVSERPMVQSDGWAMIYISDREARQGDGKPYFVTFDRTTADKSEILISERFEAYEDLVAYITKLFKNGSIKRFLG